MMIQIISNDDGFFLDGVLLPKGVFVPVNVDSFRVQLFNKYDKTFTLFKGFTPFDKIEVDGLVYTSLNELIIKLSEIL